VIISVDFATLAELTRQEAERHPQRSPARRAASHLWVALTVPPAETADTARRAIASFGDERTQSDAVALLHRLAAEAAMVKQDDEAGRRRRKERTP